MDNYLTKLVRKEDLGEINKESQEKVLVEENSVEIHLDANTESVELISETSSELKSASDELTTKGNVESNEDSTAEATTDANIKEKSTTEFNLNIVPVTNIKIYNIPDSKSPFKMFTGNVVIKGKVDQFTKLEYVKPGFGLILGYTTDLE